MKLWMKSPSFDDWDLISKDYYNYLCKKNDVKPCEYALYLFSMKKYSKILACINKEYFQTGNLINNIYRNVYNFIGLYSDNDSLIAHCFIDLYTSFFYPESNEVFIELNPIFIRNIEKYDLSKNLDNNLINNIIYQFVKFIEDNLLKIYPDAKKIGFIISWYDKNIISVLQKYCEVLPYGGKLLCEKDITKTRI